MASEIDYAADTPRQTTNMDLEEVSQLCQHQINLEDELEKLEEEMENVKQQLQQVQEKQLPDLLKEKNLSEIRLSTGEKLILQEKVFASIPVENKEPAHQWLREQGFGDLIKNLVTLTFARGEDNRAKLILEELRSRGFEPQNNVSVHPQTLKAFAREQIANGKALPEDRFVVTVVPSVKIQRKK